MSADGGTSGPGATAPTWLDLYDWRARVARMYQEREAALRLGEDPLLVVRRFRAARDALFKRHPQSPLGPEERKGFGGLRYFPYDPALAVAAELTPVEPEPEGAAAELPASGAHAMAFRRAARARCAVGGTPVELVVYWIDVYGGGLFLPFRDATGGAETYGGGRYLFDTVKGSDFLRLDLEDDDVELGGGRGMGYAGGRILLDFNLAYNPSCCYDPRWVCPLSPPENRLSIPIRAGELNYHDE
jgi:uncharacterized protein (DUF1684 family)